YGTTALRHYGTTALRHYGTTAGALAYLPAAQDNSVHSAKILAANLVLSRKNHSNTPTKQAGNTRFSAHTPQLNQP
ncbi:hypothetical protein, partial [Acetobacter orientalis]|uniref:hypothetical protein n=1 Tax=Acetobacter orientalis TaxID=146474 RepID=UPI00248E6434